MSDGIVYEPPGTVVPFFTSRKFISLICGPVGSTKTTAALMRIPYMAAKMAACKDGVRRSRCVVVRNTREMLSDATIPDFLKWFPEGQAGSYLKTERRFWLRFDDVECEVLFRGLDDANDVRRLLSLQASFGVLDEFREINKSIFEALGGRLGRFPDGMLVPHRPEWGVDSKGNPIQGCVDDEGKSMKMLWGASNPPEYDSWWQNFMDNPPDNCSVTFQPSGMSPEEDWSHLLPSDYYPNLMEGKDEDWINVYVHGKYGRSLAGKPVFPSFNYDFHVAKEPLKYIKASSIPLLIGMDFGLQPACTINQVDPFGRLLTLASVASDGMGIARFIDEKLRPVLAARFPGHPAVIIGDPAGQQRVQTDEKSCFDILRHAGFHVIPAATNSVVARISAVERQLSRQLDGKAGHLIDPGATELINALRGGYRYRLKKSGETDLAPEKNHHSHVADAHQYACLHADAGGLWGKPSRAEKREIKIMPAQGWT